MAQLITVLGAMAGFIAGLIGYFAFDISFLAAFSIWAVSGPVAAMFGFVLSTSDTCNVRENRQSTFDAAA